LLRVLARVKVEKVLFDTPMLSESNDVVMGYFTDGLEEFYNFEVL
jgi:hypothetical protein